MAHALETREDSDGVLEALGLDLPMLLLADSVDLLRDIKDTFSVVRRNRVQDVQTVDPDIDLRIA